MDGAPICPRCGYDLSGLDREWRESCPLLGVCSECGLDYRWGDVLGKGRLPGWSFEHAPGLGLRAIPKSLWVAWRPWKIWRMLRMDHPVKVPRLIVLGVLIVLACYALAALDGFVRGWMDSGNAAANVRAMLSPTGAIIPAPPPPPLTLRTQATYAAQVAAWPYADHWVRLPGRQMVETAPRLSWVVLMTPLVLVISALGFLLLPASLRRARVRRAHIVRIFVYSLTIMPISWALWWVARPDLPWNYVTVGIVTLGAPRAGAVLGATLVMVFWYWRVAIRDYLRLPHATAVAAALVTIGALVSAIIGLVN